MIKNWSIKSKLSLALAFLTVMLIGIIAVFVIENHERDQKRILENQQFTLLSVLADEISNKLNTSHDALIRVAQDIPEAYFDDQAKLQEYIELNSALYALFHNILIYSDKGVVLAANPQLTKYRGVDLSHLEYVQKTVELGKPLVSSPFVSPVSKQPLIVMTAPIISKDGEILGFIGGSQYFLKENLLGNLLTAKLGETGYFYVSATNRQVLVHPNKAHILKVIDPPGSHATYDAALNGFEGVNEDRSGSSGHALFGMKTLNFSDWMITGVLPVEEAFLPIRKSRNRLIVIVTSAAVVTLCLVWLIMQFFLTPLSLLHNHIQAYTTNPDMEEEITLSSKDEVGKLADAFNAMVQSLSKSKRISESLIKSMQDGFTELNTNGEHINANPAFLKMTGFSENEIIGSGPPHPYWPPEEIQKIEDSFQKSLEGIQSEHELVFMKKSGERFPVIVSPSSLKDEQGNVIRYFSTVKDITERKRIENSLKQNEARFRAMAENTANVIAILNENQTITYISPSIHRILGHSSHGIIDKRLDTLLDQDGFEDYLKVCQKAISRPGDSFPMMEFNMKHQDGHRVPFEGMVTNMLDISGVEGVVVDCRDISERKEYEMRIQQAQKMESIGTLAGGVAHEFNNILSIIIGNNELIMDELPEWGHARESAEEINIAGIRAREIVKQLLTFSRKDSAALKVIDLGSVVGESLKLIRSSTPASTEIRENLPEYVLPILGNTTQINQLLINLCKNAADAISDQGGLLSVDLSLEKIDKEVVVGQKVVKPGTYARLLISDDGSGMDKETLERIFEPYYTTKELGEGSGIGLAVVHGIVERHNGLIIAESTPGQGTVFTVYLPITEELPQDITENQVILPTGSERVLYVDDEPSIAKLGKRHLNNLGYSVESMTDPLAALEMFKNNPEQFDLLITDMAMPQMTGGQLITEVLKIRGDIPCIICTGYSEKMGPEEALELGVSAFLQKPLDKSDLATTVRRSIDAAT